MVIEWQRKRAEFNHDWLKIRYINALQSFLSRLRRRDLQNTKHLYEFLEQDFPAWGKYSKAAWWLVHQFENEMSPARLFDTPPLNGCPQEMKLWLAPLVHSLWLQRINVRGIVSSASALIKNIDHEFASLSKGLPGSDDRYVLKLREMFPEWESYTKLCLQLSQRLSLFPRKIEIV
jgi:hypothetical protein